MADRIIHRGPDNEGIWVDPAAGIALAHRRLAIVDLSPAGRQPMTSSCGRYVIVFNGEIYNHRQLRRKIESAGPHHWRGHSDTETLLAAIALWGLQHTLELCVGMFAFAIWDRQERSLSLARDRLGEKPLYFGHLGGSFAFASELKALRAHPHWRGEINRDALALLMRYNYIPAPYSIYAGIHKLKPAQFLVLRAPGSDPYIESYWSARAAAAAGSARPFAGNDEEVVTTLEGLIRKALEGQMMADVPLGAFLSGGIDSSTVVALMQSMSSRPVRTFTIGFQQDDYDEAAHAKKIARHLGTDHTELYVTQQEAREVIPNLPKIYCEPFSDSSQIPTYLVSKLAREHVKVSLSGDGGDELFSGYTRYALTEDAWANLCRVPGRVRCIASWLAMRISPAFYDALATPLMQLLPERKRVRRVGDRVHKIAQLIPLRSVDDVYKRLVSHWDSPSEIVIGGMEPPGLAASLDEVPTLGSNVQRMMYLDLTSYLPDDILVKVDRAAMAVSLESRVPFLDQRIVEFALSLPLNMLRQNGQSKWPLRQILYKYVPRSLVERPKMGFGVPIDNWLRGELRDWAEDLLAERRLKHEGFFHSEPIRRAWKDHLSGRRNMQYLLWDVLMFQGWLATEQSTLAG
jgi:asparagine synthase (glutamine-hydrolysing)